MFARIMRYALLCFLVIFIAGICWFLVEERTNTSAIIQLAEDKAAQFHAPAKDYAVVIDFRKSMLSRRLYLVDLQNNRIVLRSRVSHAYRSGLLYANELSNKTGSNKSCAGAFVTADPYHGKFGYSMHVRGLEKGVNHNALDRAIVFHSMKKVDFPTWSSGCFVTPKETNAYLIKKIANGRLVYVIAG